MCVCSKFKAGWFAWFFFLIIATRKGRESGIEIYHVLVFSWVKWDSVLSLVCKNITEFLGLCSQISVLTFVVHFTSTALRINIPDSWEKQRRHFYDEQQTCQVTVDLHIIVLTVDMKFCKAGYEFYSSFVKKVGCHFG